jgi:hypothetical protein
MANVIRHKRGTSDPVAGDFSQTAELLINTSDGGLFTKTDSGSVVEIGASAATADYLSNPQTLSSNTTIPSSTNAGALGPSYTIATGVTLTISTGSFFRVI